MEELFIQKRMGMDLLTMNLKRIKSKLQYNSP
uniref:Uncharacterized protein n=1 Tax=Amphimedon queenslandica TaxID=400682 RepID=A0A1X7V5I8_AMPQE